MGWTKSSIILAGVAVTSIGTFIAVLLYESRRKKFRLVGKVTKLILYPVKSFAGVEVNTAECTPLGLKANGILDRMWMVISDDHKRFVDMKSVHSFVLLTPTLPRENDDELCVRNEKDPSKPPLKIPIFKEIPLDAVFRETGIYQKNLEGMYVGDDASRWIRDYAERDDLLMLQSVEHLRNSKRSLKRNLKTYHTYNTYHMITMPSVRHLNKRINGKEVTYKNFRPNIVIDGTDLSPFQEDKWKFVKIGEEVEFEFASHCDRNPVVNVDPESGDFMPNVMQDLRSYRLTKDKKLMLKFGNAPLFGNLYEPKILGNISVGDSVYAYY